jgi:DNA-binding phage protein
MRTWGELLRERLAADAEEATEYLRASYEEHDPQMLAHAVRIVQEARGSLDGLALRQEELVAMLALLSQQTMHLAQAA